MNDARAGMSPMDPTPPERLTPSELAALYAAGALTPEETRAFEALLSAGKVEYMRALQEVMPVLRSLQSIGGSQPPPPHVLRSLLARIDAERSPQRTVPPTPGEPESEAESELGAKETHGELVSAGAPSEAISAGIAILRGSTARWRRTGLRGVRMRTLMADRRANRRTIMLDMAPGSNLPDHEHAGVEEVYMISGDLSIAGTTLHAGDYIRIDEGAEHGVPFTTGGCVCIVISNYVPFPASSLLGFVWSATKSLFGLRRSKP